MYPGHMCHRKMTLDGKNEVVQMADVVVVYNGRETYKPYSK